MDEKTAWDVYFSGICALLFHPRNDKAHNNPEHTVQTAAVIADYMLEKRGIRWPG